MLGQAITKIEREFLVSIGALIGLIGAPLWLNWNAFLS